MMHEQYYNSKSQQSQSQKGQTIIGQMPNRPSQNPIQQKSVSSINKNIKSPYLEKYQQYFKQIEQKADQIIAVQMQNKSRWIEHDIMIKDKITNQLFDNKEIKRIWIREILHFGLVLNYIVHISNFNVGIKMLNISDISQQIRHFDSGAYGQICRITCGDNNKIVTKRTRFFKETQILKNQIDQEYLKINPNKHQIEECLYQLAIYKICSLFKIGPELKNTIGFDVICYNDLMQFFMEQCVTKFQQNYELQLKIALRILHKLNIIHKDIKKQNMLFSPAYNKCVLIDFGISHQIKQQLGQLSYSYKQGTQSNMCQQMRQLQTKQGFIDLYYNDLYGLRIALKQLSTINLDRIFRRNRHDNRVTQNNFYIGIKIINYLMEYDKTNFANLIEKYGWIFQKNNTLYQISRHLDFQDIQFQNKIDLDKNDKFSRAYLSKYFRFREQIKYSLQEILLLIRVFGVDRKLIKYIHKQTQQTLIKIHDKINKRIFKDSQLFELNNQAKYYTGSRKIGSLLWQLRYFQKQIDIDYMNKKIWLRYCELIITLVQERVNINYQFLFKSIKILKHQSQQKMDHILHYLQTLQKINHNKKLVEQYCQQYYEFCLSHLTEQQIKVYNQEYSKFLDLLENNNLTKNEKIIEIQSFIKQNGVKQNIFDQNKFQRMKQLTINLFQLCRISYFNGQSLQRSSKFNIKCLYFLIIFNMTQQMVQIFIGLGQIFKNQGLYKKAMNYLLFASKFNKNKYSFQNILIICKTAFCNRFVKDVHHDKTLQELILAKQLGLAHFGMNHECIISINITIIDQLIEQHKYNECIKYFEEIFSIYRKLYEYHIVMYQAIFFRYCQVIDVLKGQQFVLYLLKKFIQQRQINRIDFSKCKLKLLNYLIMHEKYSQNWDFYVQRAFQSLINSRQLNQQVLKTFTLVIQHTYQLQVNAQSFFIKIHQLIKNLHHPSKLLFYSCITKHFHTIKKYDCSILSLNKTIDLIIDRSLLHYEFQSLNIQILNDSTFAQQLPIEHNILVKKILKIHAENFDKVASNNIIFVPFYNYYLIMLRDSNLNEGIYVWIKYHKIIIPKSELIDNTCQPLYKMRINQFYIRISNKSRYHKKYLKRIRHPDINEVFYFNVYSVLIQPYYINSFNVITKIFILIRMAHVLGIDKAHNILHILLKYKKHKLQYDVIRKIQNRTQFSFCSQKFYKELRIIKRCLFLNRKIIDFRDNGYEHKLKRFIKQRQMITKKIIKTN